MLPQTRKVFLSYRSIDRERVRPVAEALLAQGIDAWWDTWEIRPGDNFVSKINTGLDQCESGIVFLSTASLAGAWHQDEITILKTFAVDDGRPLIPVLLDPDVKVPAILRNYSRLFATDTAALIDAIQNRTANKPALGTPQPQPTRLRFSIHLHDLPNSTGIAVSAQLNNQPLVPAQTVAPGANFAFSYADFLRGNPILSRQEQHSSAASQELDLAKPFEAIGRASSANS